MVKIMTPTEQVIVAAIMADQPVNLMGDPGTGKSSMVRAIADSMNLHFEVVNLALVEPQDLIGLPIIDDSGERKAVTFAPPSWALRLAAEPRAVLLLDEVGSCARDVAAAAMQLVLDRTVGELDLSHVTVFLAGNPPENAAGSGAELPAPLANRMLHILFEGLSIDAWAEGLIGGWDLVTPEVPDIKIDDAEFRLAMLRVISFLKSSVDNFQDCPTDYVAQAGAWPSRRSWDAVTRILPYLEHFGDDAVAVGVAGLVGEQAGVSFGAWSRYKDLVDPVAILQGEADLPWEISVDALFANAMGLVAYYSGLDIDDRLKYGERVVEAIIHPDGKHRDVTKPAFDRLARALKEPMQKGLKMPKEVREYT